MKGFLKDLLSKAFETGKDSKAFSFSLSDLVTVVKRSAVVAAGAAAVAGLSYISDTFDFGVVDAMVATAVAATVTAVAAWVKDHTK